MSKKVNTPSTPGKGNPADTGQSKASIKKVHDLDNLEESQRIKDEYTDGADEIPDAVRTNNPNRNPSNNKPDINKPKY
jgi:hypothetical protein